MREILLPTLALLPSSLLLALGFAIAFRVMKFPDLTVEVSYVAGAVGATWGALRFESSLAGLLCAIALGSTAGFLTGALSSLHRSPSFRLLASTLVVFSFYSVHFRMMGGRVDRGFNGTNTLLNWLVDKDQELGLGFLRPLSTLAHYLICLVVIGGVYYVLKSKVGFVLRAVGYRPEIVENCGRNVNTVIIVGLMFSNAVVATGGWLYGSLNRNASLGQTGIIIHALAAVLLGETITRIPIFSRLSPISIKGAIFAPLVGASVYALLRSLVSTLTSGQVVSSLRDDNPLWRLLPQDINLMFALLLVGLLLIPRLLRHPSAGPPREIESL